MYLHRRAEIQRLDIKTESVDSASLVGGTSSYFFTAGLDITEGRAFNQTDEQRAARVVVLGGSISDALFPNEDPLGKQIRIQGQRFTSDWRFGEER